MKPERPSRCRLRITTAISQRIPRRSTGSKRAASSPSAIAGRAARVVEEANFNGSARAIAGIFNETRTVLGLMPHLENASDPLLGRTDGQAFFDGLVSALQ